MFSDDSGLEPRRVEADTVFEERRCDHDLVFQRLVVRELDLETADDLLLNGVLETATRDGDRL